MKQKYDGAIVSHMNAATTEKEDSADGEDGTDYLAGNLTPAKRKINDSESGKEKDNMCPFNNFTLSSWAHPETGRKYTDAFILLPSGVNRNQQYSINVSESATQLVVEITWPRILSSQDSLMKIARLSDPGVTNMHPIVGGITESFKKLKATVYDDVVKTFYVDLPYTVQSSILFMKCIAPKDSRGLSLGTMVHVRVEGIADNFANMVRDSGTIESIVL